MPQVLIRFFKPEVNYDPYQRTSSQHPTEKPEIHVGEICMVNPCSQESVCDVMKYIQNICSAGDNKNRKWTILISDGVPYTLASDIQDFVLFCQECGMEVDRKGISSAEFEEFLITYESLCRADIPIRERFTLSFMNLLLLSGLGRVELNQSCIFLKLLWEPILSHVVSLLGFRAPRAKQVVKEEIDHHRSRQILKACLEAISKEFLTPHAQDCMKNNTSPNTESYHIWFSNVKDHTYLFYYHVTFSFLLSFHLLTEAVRKNKSEHYGSKSTVFFLFTIYDINICICVIFGSVCKCLRN